MKRIPSFLWFALFYLSPMLANLVLTTDFTDGLLFLLEKGLFRFSMVMDMLFFLGVTLVSLLLCFWALRWAAVCLLRALRLPESRWLFWGMLFGGLAIFSLNGFFFPLSNYAFIAPAYLGAGLLALPIAYAAALLLALMTLYKRRELPRPRLTLAALLIAGALSLILFWPDATSPETDAPPFAANIAPSAVSDAPPNIIILGVDALSAFMLERARADGLMPTLDALLQKGVVYTRAYTPLGRTFPAWTSLLTGETPQEHGAVFNLRQLDKVKKDQLLSLQLQQQGYKTIWAIDERRFNNMDRSFGFDEVIGPKTGVMDFIAQKVTDHPLFNALLQTRLARHLLPYAYLNSTYAFSYDAHGFVNAVLAASAAEKPLFLAVHLESTHWPWESRHVRVRVEDESTWASNYLSVLPVADWQIRDILAGLARQGALQNTLVILMSDHGEGLALVEKRLDMPGNPSVTSMGHGADLLSDHQNRILLATLVFRDGKIVNAPKSVSEQVSLLDVKATILRFLEQGEARIQADEPCLIVETGQRLKAVDGLAKPDNQAMLAEAGNRYNINKEGLQEFYEELVPILLETKDIGVRCKNRITYYSMKSGKYLAFTLDDNGLPDKPIPAPREDVERIRQYANGYDVTLPSWANNPPPVTQVPDSGYSFTIQH
ncbi:MAG: sulfatase-like hydrolase/transferase [Zoogloeaceae bacterium]|nr:sulfatase-like hydrolase/transferase [Zoogloeaceae bacterium]